MYSIVFYINTVGLYWQEKSTLLINKKHRIHNPRKKSRKARRQFSAIRLKMKKRFESVQKLKIVDDEAKEEGFAWMQQR